MKKYWILLLLIFCMISAGYAKAEFEVTYFAEEANRDTYYREVIQLALEKTQPKYGSFKFTVVSNVPTQRRFAFLQENTLPNAVVLRGYDKNFQSSGNLTYIDFPMDLGALSMRICFVSPQSKEKSARQNR